MIKELKQVICDVRSLKSADEVAIDSEKDDLSIPPTPPPLPPPLVMEVFLGPLEVLHA